MVEVEGAWGIETEDKALIVDALSDETMEAVRTRFLGLTVGAVALIDIVREIALLFGTDSALPPPEKLTPD